MLPFLEEKIKTNGGIFKQKFIKNLEELVDFDLIINCTGVKAGTLAQDYRVHSIRGQVTRVRNYYILENQICIIILYYCPR